MYPSPYSSLRCPGLPYTTNLPLIMMTILSQRDSASSILCVVRINELPSRFLSILKRLLLETGSTPVVGSSRNSHFGDARSDIAQTSFLLFPPLKFPHKVYEYISRSRVCLMNSFWNATSAGGTPLTSAMKARHWSTDIVSQIVLNCGHIPNLFPSLTISIESKF